MAIHRSRLPGDNFTMVPTAWLRDTRLSLTAKGILVFLVTVPRGQAVPESKVTESGRPGDPADVADALDLLKSTGYLLKDDAGDLWLSAPGQVA